MDGTPNQALHLTAAALAVILASTCICRRGGKWDQWLTQSK
jgi:hypothetical protein